MSENHDEPASVVRRHADHIARFYGVGAGLIIGAKIYREGSADVA